MRRWIIFIDARSKPVISIMRLKTLYMTLALDLIDASWAIRFNKHQDVLPLWLNISELGGRSAKVQHSLIELSSVTAIICKPRVWYTLVNKSFKFEDDKWNYDIQGPLIIYVTKIVMIWWSNNGISNMYIPAKSCPHMAAEKVGVRSKHIQSLSIEG